ncbi:MAG: IS66 family insertion sequence element accessory protein TnpB [Bacteroidetes bacterium]|nr:IS66 family insertion sequence element accessory protein TnpB [Bacteroidota bacterium]
MTGTGILFMAGCDMRKGYDCLNGLVRNEFKKDPLLGDVFIFLSRRNKIKLFHWQGDGFCIFSKRLEKGTFEIPKAEFIPKCHGNISTSTSIYS